MVDFHPVIWRGVRRGATPTGPASTTMDTSPANNTLIRSKRTADTLPHPDQRTPITLDTIGTSGWAPRPRSPPTGRAASGSTSSPRPCGPAGGSGHRVSTRRESPLPEGAEAVAAGAARRSGPRCAHWAAPASPTLSRDWCVTPARGPKASCRSRAPRYSRSVHPDVRRLRRRRAHRRGDPGAAGGRHSVDVRLPLTGEGVLCVSVSNWSTGDAAVEASLAARAARSGSLAPGP